MMPPVWQPAFQKRGIIDFPVDQRVWIGGIPPEGDYKTMIKALKEHLSQAGNCKWVFAAKGNGGCAFSSATEAQTAIAMLNGSVFQGTVLQLDVWTEKDKSERKGAGKGAWKGKGKW
eukprot:gnl/TRDRNA2_/TRDRNA2_176035_c1_seq1.p2 gnl/TRDRNA2_/TRDRNA2_176035_c1~~gnl/TRDRNA2_/TRDRNA2_176035_c1_seq1.p2  ORF type:complete len:128 (+),score=24.10 gnl/TRDRNA2_/TRDRNA2_176035_c1_seq1:35-385(+)